MNKYFLFSYINSEHCQNPSSVDRTKLMWCHVTMAPLRNIFHPHPYNIFKYSTYVERIRKCYHYLFYTHIFNWSHLCCALVNKTDLKLWGVGSNADESLPIKCCLTPLIVPVWNVKSAGACHAMYVSSGSFRSLAFMLSLMFTEWLEHRYLDNIRPDVAFRLCEG